MKNLIIIGNGFDLAHGLKTTYYDYITAAKKCSTYTDGIITTKLKAFTDKNTNLLYNSILNHNGDKWSDIENAYFDILTHINDEKYITKKYKLQISNTYDVTNLNDDFEEIKLSLVKYLKDQEEEFKINDEYQRMFELFQKQETLIVNFNYTKTVKEYLNKITSGSQTIQNATNIKLIHMHGELDNENNPIIFGFAADNEESKKLLIENDNKYVRNIKKFNYLYTENEENLKEHLKSTEYNIFIFGHSCGISDKLILNEIFNSQNIHKIYPFYYNDSNGYFDTMVNIDRIIDDYSKGNSDYKSFSKLVSFPKACPMPQVNQENSNFIPYLQNILNTKLPSEIPKKISGKKDFWK